MKIGIFDPYLDTLSGGEKYILTAASCLSKNNEVFIFWDSDEEKIKAKAKSKLSIDLDKVKFAPNIFGKEYPRLSRLLESKNFDLIIYLSDGSIPVVLSKLIVHFQFPVEWIKNNLKTKFKFSRVEKIICNSEFTKSFIDKKLGVKSVVLYPPCEIKDQKLKKENIVLHVGRFGTDVEGRNFKKQDFMINAFQELKIKDWKFVLVIGFMPGDAGKVNGLKKIAKGYNIEIIENPKNDKLWELYSRSKIYWHASGFGEDLAKYPEKAEHFGISTVEAMGAGAVPVVINAGGQKEIVEENKSGFLWNSIGDLLGKTQTLINDQILWGKMSKLAVERSRVFSTDRFCKELVDLIK